MSRPGLARLLRVMSEGGEECVAALEVIRGGAVMEDGRGVAGE
jgi:hypothetical protein